MVKIWKRLSTIWYGFENIALAVFMVAMFILVGYNVLVRYIIGGTLPSAWAEVMVRLILACITFLGATLVEREQGHFAVGVIVDRLNSHVRLWIKVLVDLIVVGFLAVIVRQALTIVPDQLQQPTDSWSVLPFGLWPLLVLIMAVLMLAYIIARIIRNIQGALQS
jgi:TRAP-type C4-dicarboxylate transport system permease small subunit